MACSLGSLMLAVRLLPALEFQDVEASRAEDNCGNVIWPHGKAWNALRGPGFLLAMVRVGAQWQHLSCAPHIFQRESSFMLKYVSFEVQIITNVLEACQNPHGQVSLGLLTTI